MCVIMCQRNKNVQKNDNNNLLWENLLVVATSYVDIDQNRQ